MSFHLIIDGYNLIRQSPELLHYEKQDLEKGRAMLLRRLIAYQRIKHHSITVVFDGWAEGDIFERRGKEGGIEIIFSRRGEKADEVIKRLAAQKKSEITVVTSDRDLGHSCALNGCTIVSSPEFLEKMEFAQYSEDKGIVDETKDTLPPVKSTKKKGPSKRAPKSIRHHQSLLKKL
ncbi:MAG: NYN domain-containing protein [Thermodesulfobacteriota bacterium]|jgi:predicted RNA-binding protein with PIN domain|nr:MAG: NYN domain-containing protein [Thermodesulfobacteriota bacterium]